jgi:hypothetical protein
MKLSQLKNTLTQMERLSFTLPDGKAIPAHFHITEAGLTTKHFVDCGGTIRTEKTISFQIWVAQDVDHRLTPSKLNKIIQLAEPLFADQDLEVEMEYQQDTISRYAVTYAENQFQLLPLYTNCLATDHCGIPDEKLKVNLADLEPSKTVSCSPGGGCC